MLVSSSTMTDLNLICSLMYPKQFKQCLAHSRRSTDNLLDGRGVWAEWLSDYVLHGEPACCVSQHTGLPGLLRCLIFLGTALAGTPASDGPEWVNYTPASLWDSLAQRKAPCPAASSSPDGNNSGHEWLVSRHISHLAS